MPSLMATLAEIIRDARERIGISQAEFARRVGVSRSTTSDWEKGETAPRRDLAPLVAQVLRIPLGAIIPLADPQLETIDVHSAQREIRLIDWDELGHTIAAVRGVVRRLIVDNDVPEDAVALRVRDESMSPDYSVGDIIVIVPAPMPPRDGDDVVVTLPAGESLLRRCAVRGVDSTGAPAYDLRPLSPD
jgi:transcriptional regulator with XRE-family HTH domain